MKKMLLIIPVVVLIGACAPSHNVRKSGSGTFATPTTSSPSSFYTDPNTYYTPSPEPTVTPKHVVKKATVAKKKVVHHKPKVTKPSGGNGAGPFTCRDGTISYAKHRQGACSHHGGIA
jgi:hypothetical protein